MLISVLKWMKSEREGAWSRALREVAEAKMITAAANSFDRSATSSAVPCRAVRPRT
jgi:hypothetical protein